MSADPDDLNLLLLTFDQLRADAVLGPLAEAVPTPAFDRLRASATNFSDHVTVTAPCGPARASLLTGLHPSNHGALRNGTPLAKGLTNLAFQLREAGREPLLFGYTDAAPDPDDAHPADPALASYEGVLPGFREVVEMRFESPSTWLAHLSKRGYALPRPLPKRLFDLQIPVAEGRAPNPSDPAPYRAEDSETAFLMDELLAHLEVRRDAPWTAHAAFIRPHPPFVAPAPFNRAVAPSAVPPRTPAHPDHPFVRAWFSERSSFGTWMLFNGDCAGLPEETIAELRAVYLGLVAECDHHLGRLLDWLEATGQAGRTLLVVTSDHGEMLGDGRMWGKASVFDPAFRIPLMIRDPRRPESHGRAVSAKTESVDVAPTILDLLDRTVPPQWDGRSLRPFLDGAAPDTWRDAQLMEIDFAEPEAPTRFQRAWGTGPRDSGAAILRASRWKLVRFSGPAPPLLFDLEADPQETEDLAAARPDILAEMTEALLRRRLAQAGRARAHLAIGVRTP